MRPHRSHPPKTLIACAIVVLFSWVLAVPLASAEDVPAATGNEASAEASDVEVPDSRVEPTPSPEPDPSPEPQPTEPAPEPTEPAPEPTAPEIEASPDPEPGVPPGDGTTGEKDDAVTPRAEEAKTETRGGERSEPAAGNEGTVKVDGTALDSHPNNEPKPSCTFQIDYTGFDPNQVVSHSFSIQSGPGNGTFLDGISDQALGADGAGSFTHNLSGPLSALAPSPDGRYHVRLDVDTGGPGGQKHKVFKVLCGAPDQEGFVIIEKDVLTADAPDASFGFTGDLGTFSLSDGDSIGPVSVDPGSFSVTETISNAQSDAGWSFDSVTCEVVDSPDLVGGVLTESQHSANFEVADGETVKCTFKNDYEHPATSGKVIVQKRVIGEVAGGSQDFSFDGDLGTFTLSGGDSKTFSVTPGVFVVEEEMSGLGKGWSLDSARCTERKTSNGNVVSTVHGALATIDVSDGETVRCVYTNSYLEVGPNDEGAPPTKHRPPRVLPGILERGPTPDVGPGNAFKPRLPFTGSDVLPLVWLGSLLIATGLLALWARRRET